MPKRASIVYFCYHGIKPFKLESYKWVDNGVFTYANKIISTPFFLRLKAVPAKIYSRIISGDKELFSNLLTYTSNLILGKTKNNKL